MIWIGSNQATRGCVSPALSPQSKIALILGKYDQPEQPYLTSWVDSLRCSGIQCDLYSAQPVQTTRLAGVQVLRSMGRTQKVIRLADWFRRWPQASLRWILQANHEPLRYKLSTWAQFGPLLAQAHDVVHLVNSYTYTEFAPLLGNSSRLIISFRGYDTVVRPWIDPEWRDLLRDIYLRSAYLHFVSKYLRDEAVALGAPAEKSLVIYPGVDVHFFDPAVVTKSNEDNALHLITVGRLTWEKGYIYALRAVKQLIESGCRVAYRIVGYGADQAELNFWTRRLGLSSAVTFLGSRNPNEVRELLGSSDVYIQPSISEALCVAAMEASAMCLPVVATSTGGLPELIEDEVTGLLVPPAEPDALATAVTRLAQDPSERLRLGLAGRKRVLESFALEKEIAQWLKLYAGAWESMAMVA